jgi:hypothetical protein
MSTIYNVAAKMEMDTQKGAGRPLMSLRMLPTMTKVEEAVSRKAKALTSTKLTTSFRILLNLLITKKTAICPQKAHLVETVIETLKFWQPTRTQS